MTTTVDDLEIEKFQKMASEWWDPKGKFKPLHMLNPCRLDYINSQISYEFDIDLKEDLQKIYEEMYSVLQKERGEKPIQNETENKETTQPINMDSMKKELLDYINTLE